LEITSEPFAALAPFETGHSRDLFCFCCSLSYLALLLLWGSRRTFLADSLCNPLRAIVAIGFSPSISPSPSAASAAEVSLRQFLFEPLHCDSDCIV
jgi:hypothetical protein